MLSITLKESNKVIQGKIYEALAKEINSYLSSKSQAVLGAVSNKASSAIMNSPEILSLKGGKLKGDFGLTSDPSIPIVSSIISTLKIDFTKVDKNFKGGFLLTMQPIDYSNLFSLSASKQIIEGGSIPWLKWLLTLGDSIIIANFGVEYGPFGRSGKARMTEKQRPFKVDSAYSGNTTDNFITRSIQTNKSSIEEAIIKVLK
jgi:hypothetical protein